MLRKFRLAAAGGAMLCAVYAQPYRPMVFVGQSMEPTYSSFSVALTKPASTIHRGDIVVLRTKDGTIVKRVVFLPGDEILQMMDSHGWHDVTTIEMPRHMELLKPPHRLYTIPPGHIYVLGDNRTNSVDSRVYGAFPVSAIVGQLVNPRPYNSTPTVAYCMADRKTIAVN